MKKRFLAAILIVFVVLSLLLYGIWNVKPELRYDVVMIGNGTMALLSIASFFLTTKDLHGNPNAFVRGAISSSFLKLFVCVVGVVVYAMLNKDNVHKPSLFILFGIYAVYSVVETRLLTRMAKQTK